MEIFADIGFPGNLGPSQNNQELMASLEIHECSILIVDDELLICELIRAQLIAAGFINIDTAEDGLSGLERINHSKPDLVILDIEMPGMNGIDILKNIRQNPAFDDLPIIVQTAHDSVSFRNSVLRAGATNIINKPIDFELLIRRVRTHLEHWLLVNSLKSYQHRVEQELESARSMQLQLMPREADVMKIAQQYGVAVDWHYLPSSELSGDYWGIHPVNKQKFAVFIVDFTGHGVGSAINTFRLHTVMKDVNLDANSPARCLKTLNERLIELMPRGQFATMNYSIIDVEKNTLTYASAGHTAPIIGRGAAKSLFLGNPVGLPLGIQKEAIYTDHEIALIPGDLLFLYSDALTETPGENTRPLDDVGLLDLLHQVLSLSDHKRPLDWLLEKFYGRSNKVPSDDVTAVWVQR